MGYFVGRDSPSSHYSSATKLIPPQALGLGVTRVVAFGPFRQKPLSAALATPRQDGPPAFGPHASPKPVLTFPGSFRWLVSAFHNNIKIDARLGAATVGSCAVLSTWHWLPANEALILIGSVRNNKPPFFCFLSFFSSHLPAFTDILSDYRAEEHGQDAHATMIGITIASLCSF